MKILPVFLQQKGCKNKCIFCSQWAVTGFERPSCFDELDKLVQNYSKTTDSFEIAFYGGTFTAMDESEQRSYFRWASRYVQAGICSGIRLSTRPDEIDEPRAHFLKEHGVKFIELGVQSFDDEVLRLNNRGYTRSDVLKACEILKEFEIDFGIHLMVGLLGDEALKDILSAWQTTEMKAKSCRIHPTLVLKGSILETIYQRGEYVPLDLHTAIDICSDMTAILESQGVRVIRLGLYVPPELLRNVMAGPYHPRFGELVRTRLVEKLYSFLNASSIVHTDRESSWVSRLNVPKSRDKVFGFMVQGGFVAWQDALERYAEKTLEEVVLCSKR
ncbi:MAG: radical SAM protein [Pseudothermotoga sp.]|nr:radical SAM protein [Pseudothermotoga sp.]